MRDWIKNSITEGSMGPILKGVDSEGNRVQIVEHPLNAIDPADMHFLMLRDNPEHPEAPSEHMSFTIKRARAGMFLFRILSMLSQKDPTLVSDFCDMFGKTYGKHKETPKGDA